MAGCLTQLSKVCMGNIDKGGRNWHGEIEISVEKSPVTSYHSRQRDYTRRYERWYLATLVEVISSLKSGR